MGGLFFAIMSVVIEGSRPSGNAILGHEAKVIHSGKAERYFRVGMEPLASGDTEIRSVGEIFLQEVNLRKRLAKSYMLMAFSELPDEIAKAHENPLLAHHNGPHANRVEHTLQALILRTMNLEEQDALESNPEILGAALIFPRGHDFWHQVLTGQRKFNGEKSLNAKRGHDKAAGIVMAAQIEEYAEVLRETYKDTKEMSDEQIKQEARNTMLLAQIMSAPHGYPRTYEAVIGQRTKKAYEEVIDEATGEPRKVPLPHQTEQDARALFDVYMSGDLDPFSLNQAQMNAITTYELTHNIKNGSVDTENFDSATVTTHDYGSTPLGLHPALQERYGEILRELVEDQRPFEDILPAEIMDQRDLIEYMGKLALFADTFDLVSDPTGRVVRSLLTQTTFTGKNPRPVWPHGLTEGEVDAMLEEVKEGDGNDIQTAPGEDKGYSLTRRLDWEIKHWYPFNEDLDPEIETLRGELSLMAAFEQFRIIEAWMGQDPNLWSEPLNTFYHERVAKYDEKYTRRQAGTAFDSEWLHQEKNGIPDILRGLPHAEQFTEDDIAMFRRYAEMSLEDTRVQYGIDPKKFEEIRALSSGRQRYDSPYIKDMYDIVFATQGRPPIRGVELD